MCTYILHLGFRILHHGNRRVQGKRIHSLSSSLLHTYNNIHATYLCTFCPVSETGLSSGSTVTCVYEVIRAQASVFIRIKTSDAHYLWVTPGNLSSAWEKTHLCWQPVNSTCGKYQLLHHITSQLYKIRLYCQEVTTENTILLSPLCWHLCFFEWMVPCGRSGRHSEHCRLFYIHTQHRALHRHCYSSACFYPCSSLYLPSLTLLIQFFSPNNDVS